MKYSAPARDVSIRQTSGLQWRWPSSLCFHAAMRIHSRYTRLVADVPCGGLQVQLVLHGRKFFCDTPECPRKIFTERLSVFVQALGPHDARLCQMLQALGLAT